MSTPVLARISLTDQEWKALRKLAIERDENTSTLLAEALRVSPLTKAAIQAAEATK
jgi:hypothetical protein